MADSRDFYQSAPTHQSAMDSLGQTRKNALLYDVTERKHFAVMTPCCLDGTWQDGYGNSMDKCPVHGITPHA